MMIEIMNCSKSQIPRDWRCAYRWNIYTNEFKFIVEVLNGKFVFPVPKFRFDYELHLLNICGVFRFKVPIKLFLFFRRTVDAGFLNRLNSPIISYLINLESQLRLSSHIWG